MSMKHCTVDKQCTVLSHSASLFVVVMVFVCDNIDNKCSDACILSMVITIIEILTVPATVICLISYNIICLNTCQLKLNNIRYANYNLDRLNYPPSHEYYG